MDLDLHRLVRRLSHAVQLLLETRSRQRRRLHGLALAALAGASVACESAVSTDPGVTGPTGATGATVSGFGGATTTSATGGPGGDGEPDGGEVQPDAPESCESKVKGTFTCCNDEPCRGGCMTKGCDCAGIDGGCWAPLICCWNVCTTEAWCDYQAGQ